MSDDERRIVELRVHETAARQQVAVKHQSTTTLRLSGPRPLQAFEVDGASGFHPGGSLPLPEPPGALTAIAAALAHAAARPGVDVLLVAGHGADAALVARRAAAVAALLAGAKDEFATLAAEHGTVRDWQAALAWLAATRGWACSPGGVDGLIGPKSRAALKAFRAQVDLSGGDASAAGDEDWAAIFDAYEDALARALGLAGREALAEKREGVRFLEQRAVGCAAHWPKDRVRIFEHTTLADERVDVLCFPEEHAPLLACHAGDEGACEPKQCDVYRKGKYRCERCHPTEAPGDFRCLEVPGPHFDFDRSFVRPDGFASLRLSAGLLAEDPARRGLIFGHTDTVGTDAYNKTLSERRASSVLAVLTRDVDAWDALWTGERWDDAVARTMLGAVGDGAAPATLAPALKAFQTQAELPPTGALDAATRRRLIAAYLEVAVPQPAAAERFRDFDGRRFMGCGEFNPVTASGKDEASRRVVVMVHAPAADPGPLPCRVGDLGPCNASCRPAGAPSPLGAKDATPFFRCTVYRRLAALCACKQAPTPPTPPAPGAPVIELFTGEPEGGEPGTDLTIEQHTKVFVRWKVTGADEVEVFQVNAADGARGSRHKGPELEALLEHVPPRPGVTYELEARKGAATATAKVRVTITVPARPVIKAFSVAGEEVEGTVDLAFDWLIAGPHGRVRLLPFGKDVTADTIDGSGMFFGPPTGDGTYTLHVFDQADELADTRSVTWELPGKKDPPPKPVDPKPPAKKTRVALFGGHLEKAPDKTPKPEVKDVPAGERVALLTRVEGPWQKIYISPFPGIVANGGGDGWTGVTLVTPSVKAQGPAPDGHYTLSVDDKASAKVKVGVQGSGAIELSPQVEWDPTIAKMHWRFVEIELKAIVGLKFKVMVGEGETLATVEAKVANKAELRLETAKEAKMDEVGAPAWVVSSVDSVKAATGATIDLKAGKAEVTAKFEVTFKEIKPKGKLTGTVFGRVPKGEIEFVGIQIAKGDDGKWKLTKPGTVKGKIAVEWPVGKLLKEKWGLPWDLLDVTLIGGFAPEASPDYLQIATAVIGFDGLIAVGLIGVGVLVVIEVVRLGIRVGEFRQAHELRPLADAFFADVMQGVPDGMRDPYLENQGVKPELPPSTQDDAATRRARGRVFGAMYRGASLDAYRKQPDLRQALNGMREGARNRTPPTPEAEIDAQLDDYVMTSFHREWKEKFNITLGRVRHELWLQVRRSFYLTFATDTPENPIARDIAFRSLFMDGREGMDYDYPDVDDELFERAMADQWHAAGKSGGAGGKAYLEAVWTKAGYERFPPDRLDRAAKREKKKDETGVIDIVTGKPVPLDQAVVRDVLLQQLRDRGIYPRKTGTSAEVTEGLPWKSLLKCLMNLPGNPTKQDCATGDGTTIYNPVLFKIYSADHGREWVLADVSKPAWVERNPIQI